MIYCDDIMTLIDGVMKILNNISYDNKDEIKAIYQHNPELAMEYNLRYTAGKKCSGQEIMFASDNLIFNKIDPITLQKTG